MSGIAVDVLEPFHLILITLTAYITASILMRINHKEDKSFAQCFAAAKTAALTPKSKDFPLYNSVQLCTCSPLQLLPLPIPQKMSKRVGNIQINMQPNLKSQKQVL